MLIQLSTFPMSKVRTITSAFENSAERASEIDSYLVIGVRLKVFVLSKVNLKVPCAGPVKCVCYSHLVSCFEGLSMFSIAEKAHAITINLTYLILAIWHTPA